MPYGIQEFWSNCEQCSQFCDLFTEEKEYIILYVYFETLDYPLFWFLSEKEQQERARWTMSSQKILEVTDVILSMNV